ncbi:MAG: murein L,D-transpeptidase catalytic domain family protein [Filimonas sp.]|nr:murein L,D-transpeptidase catalytic domain family protein [Filimonas sp.]
MKIYFTLALTIASLFAIACNQQDHTYAANKVADSTLLSNVFKTRALNLCKNAAAYAKSHAMNEQYFFFADLSAHSGLKRFVVVDMQQQKVITAGLVAHGAGGPYFADTARFSNVPNSYCSSVGRYKVGEKYPGRFGSAYKLYGLDKTNDKAYDRSVVLHAYDCVTDVTIYPAYTCNSLGCPMVSYTFLKTLSGYIDKSRKPILLWIVGK